MLSIMTTPKQFCVPRDVILNATRDGRLSAVRDRHCILCVDPSAVLRLCRANTPAPRATVSGAVPLRLLGADRLALVIAQQAHLLRESEQSGLPGASRAPVAISLSGSEARDGLPRCTGAPA
jgi:hypothetical protein